MPTRGLPVVILVCRRPAGSPPNVSAPIDFSVFLPPLALLSLPIPLGESPYSAPQPAPFSFLSLYHWSKPVESAFSPFPSRVFVAVPFRSGDLTIAPSLFLYHRSVPAASSLSLPSFHQPLPFPPREDAPKLDRSRNVGTSPFDPSPFKDGSSSLSRTTVYGGHRLYEAWPPCP